MARTPSSWNLNDPDERRRLLNAALAKVRRLATRLPFTRDLLAAWFAVRDPDTPWAAKLTLLGALAYFVAPLDLIPDFLGPLGFTDDGAVLMLAIRALSGAVTPVHYRKADEALAAFRGEGQDPFGDVIDTTCEP